MDRYIYGYIHAMLLILFLLPLDGKSQLTISGQLRTRSEFRDGQGTLPEKGAVPAFFTSQRTRLNFGYSGYRYKFYTVVQDVRVWGQDASSINRTTTSDNNGAMLHEAWAEISLLDTGSVIENLSLKIGRQELVYNDHRILGNLEWLQQARRHDAALLKFLHKGWTVHAGFAFNQNREYKSGTMYNGVPVGYPAGTNGIGVMYKSMQFLFLNKKISSYNTSLVLVKDDFNRYSLSGATRGLERGVWSRWTGGYHFEGVFLKKLNVISAAYYQGGSDRNGRDLKAYMFTIHTPYQISSSFSTGPGVDIMSGNDGLKTENVNRAFDPLYGTPHKFWGLMDYFYVADPFGSAGLKDFYLRSKVKLTRSLSSMIEVHEFHSASRIADPNSAEPKAMDSRLGTEIDVVFNYVLTPAVSAEGAYCVMFGTNTLNRIKPPATDKRFTGHWAYLMIIIKPTFM
ncbi:MAG: alginate export family protein [Cytophagaceae bacterium]